MANTLHGPYSKTSWVSGTTPMSQPNMTNLETQSGVALASLNPDLVGAGFVLSGVTPTRHNAYAAGVLATETANLLRYYRMDESVGAVAFDSSGNLQAGTYTNAPTLGVAGLLTGDPDTCITLAAASSQYVSVPNSGLPTGNGAMTLALWFKFAANPASNQQLICYGNSATNHDALSIYLTTSGQAQSDVGVGSTGIHSGALTTGTPHFAVATWDGTTLTLYVDGASVATQTPGNQAVPASPTVNIGATQAPGGYFSGQIDEVAIWSKALTLAEVSNLYTLGTTATTQLDIALGEAYLIQSDGTLCRCDVGATNETTITANTTYYLDLQPDGTWYWSTSNSPQANSLQICTVTTDGSGNVKLVTDTRPTTITMFPSALGPIGFPVIVARAINVHVTATTLQTILTYAVPVSGLYRISGAFCGNPSGASYTPLIEFTYTGGNYGNGLTVDMTGPTGGVYNGSLGASKGFDLALIPQVVYLKAGTNLTCQYQDTATSPNDFITFLVERLA